MELLYLGLRSVPEVVVRRYYNYCVFCWFELRVRKYGWWFADNSEKEPVIGNLKPVDLAMI